MESKCTGGPLPLSRRQFIGSAVALGASLSASGFPSPSIRLAGASQRTVCIFSKHLQWLPVAEIGNVAADLGFDGIDLTVRRGGHVDPGRVTDDLPKAVEMIKKAGLEVPMIVTDIVDTEDPRTEPLLKTAGQLGIKYYRMGYLKYPADTDVLTNLSRYTPQLQRLAALNQKYGIQGAYQNHAGSNVGSAVWDLYILLKDIDPRWLGCQYDIKHAVAEGGMSWVNGLDVLKSRIGCVDIKDFIWARDGNKWHNQVVALGEGMVDFKKYFSLLKNYGISGPMSQHFEYPLGGAETGNKQLSMDRSLVLAAMKRDLIKLRSLLTETNAEK
jgi:L-ribulose-5-phosphate 3-epimerase